MATSARADALLADHDHTTALYHDCASRQRRLAQAVEEWERTAWQWYCDAARRIGHVAEGCPRG